MAPATLQFSTPRAAPEQTDNALRDEVHRRLFGQIQEDRETGCLVFTGCWQERTDYGLIRFNGKQYLAHRLAAWLDIGGFDLDDPTVEVYHLCSCPACIHTGDVDDDDPNGPLVGGHLLIVRHAAAQARAA